jgi:DNA polymerase
VIKSNKLHLDFETRSTLDLRKDKCGSYNYSRHASTSILCCAFSLNDEPVKLIPFEDFNIALLGNISNKLQKLYEYASDPEILFIAHNAFFEKCIWNNILVKYSEAPKISYTRWRCTLAKCAYYSLPKSLDNAAKALKVGHKFVDGKNAMLKMSKPRKPTKNNPSIWDDSKESLELLYKYNIADVELEREIDSTLPDIPAIEQKIWFFDQQMNQRGIPIDTQSVKLVQEKFDQLVDAGNAEFERITGCRVKQTVAFKDWLNEWHGVGVNSVDAATITRLISEYESDGDPATDETFFRALELRQELGATTSITKLKSMLTYACPEDQRVRDAFQYSSGITHRWGGKAIQPQNLPRVENADEMTAFEEVLNTGAVDRIKDTKQIKKGLRALIRAGVNKKLLIGDYSQIEPRINFYISGEEKGLLKFANNEDIYLDLAKQIYGNPNLTKDNKVERQLGKMAILGCGYQMGASKFQSQAKAQWGMDINTEMAEKVVATYRDYYSKVKKFWYDQEAAAIRAMETGELVMSQQKIGWYKTKIGPHNLPYLICVLPNKNKLYYFRPWISQEEFFGRAKATLNYYKVDPQTGQMKAEKTYGGKLVENIVQAVSRDIMAAAMLRIIKHNKQHNKRYDVIMTVHDELVAEVDDIETYNEKEFAEIMEAREAWFIDAPIKAEVKTAYRYTK